MSKLRITIPILVLLISSSFSFGQVEDNPEKDFMDLSLEELMNVEIEAATKTKIKQIDIPQAISILTKDEIERISANNLGELVGNIVGVNVVRVHTSENVITTRGSNAFAPAKILILIDGQPIDPTIFSTTWWELVPVSINMIERIEFIRSPGTIYGANAENGVVNIITKKMPDGDQKHVVEGNINYGQQNMLRGNLNYMGKSKSGKVSYRLFSEMYQVDSYVNDKEIEIVPGKINDHGEQSFTDDNRMLNLQTFNIGVSYKSNDKQLDFSSGIKNIARAQGRVPDRLCLINLTGFTSYTNVRYSFKALDASNSIMIGSDIINYKFLKNNNTSVLNKAGLSQNNLNLTYDFKKVIKKHSVLFGLNLKTESVNNLTDTKLVMDNNVVNFSPVFNGYFQDQWSLTDKLTLFYGGLLSNHYISGTNFAPLVSAGMKLGEKTTLRVSSFTTYRNPIVFEHSMDYSQFTGSSGKNTILLSNSNLESEKTTSFELGIRSFAIENVYLSIDLFYNQIKNGIEWSLVGADSSIINTPIYQSQNTLSQDVIGAELQVKYSFLHYFTIENNATYTSITNSSSDAVYNTDINGVGEGRYGAQYTPPIIYNAILEFNYKKLHANIYFQYVGEHTWQWPSWQSDTNLDKFSLKNVPAYYTINAYFGYDLTKNISISTQGINLLNKLHTEWRGDKSYFGRMVWAKLSFKM